MGTYCSHECVGLSYLDVRDKDSLKKVFSLFEPEVVVMAGGITDVDLCTLKPKFAQEVNVEGTANLVKEIKEYSSKLVYVSTDYIFDGKSGPYKENDKPNPINAYGKTKLESENIVRTKLKDYLIVRTSQLYGVAERSSAPNSNFALKIIHNMKTGKKVYAADDFYSTPTYAGSISEIIIKLIEKKAKGVYHGAGAEFINRYDYVNKIADIFGLDKNLIQEVKLKDLKLKAARPKKGGLKIDKAAEEIDCRLLSCTDSLELFREDLNNHE